jgi:hypothetical protein
MPLYRLSDATQLGSGAAFLACIADELRLIE